MNKNIDWITIGRLHKTNRPNILKGKIFIKDLEVELEVLGFIKTEDQKEKSSDADLVICFAQEKIKNIFE